MPSERDKADWAYGEREEGMYERFTDRARKIMRELVQAEARRFNDAYIGTEHLLLGLAKDGGGVAAHVLENRLGIDLQKIRLEIEKLIPIGQKTVLPSRMLASTQHTRKVIEYSLEESRNLNHSHVGTEHLLLGLLREKEGAAAHVLGLLGIELADVRREILAQDGSPD